MMRQNIFFVFFLLNISLAFVCPSAFAELNGDQRTTHVAEEFVIHTNETDLETATRIERYINNEFGEQSQSERKRNNVTTAELARQITVVSRCFKIEPYLFTALIQTESVSFKQHATSRTGAAGLTQFTGIAIQEVHDQLGQRGEKNALGSAIEYFQNTVTSDCIRSELLGGENFVPLYEIPGNNDQLLRENTTISLIYGAILLKTYLSVVQSRNSRSACDNSGNGVDLLSLYKRTFFKYNGEKCSVQRGYVSKIVNNIYPRILETQLQ